MTFIRWVIFCLLIFIKKSRETWRYGNEIGQSELFNTRNPIKLEYLVEQDGVEIEWQINGNCVVSNKSSQVASLTCSKPGQYKVDLKLNGSSTEEAGRYINVQAYHACYRWYLVKSNNQSLSVRIHHENTESTSDHTMASFFHDLSSKQL
ncbi:cation channel sperm-associated protein subunit epsilon-like [Lingula anatina]|uniref:Cation channel sperm-associated protein subunit epsilon-like n=1 Tax=Lingula anatina TaxID=7574 RepID=A0A1S3HE68_LINAN|nr:cation channel sperm-associated protein subunit epsilon-like [Lingula anatina]|eukprot:XP_013384348.1 cation channel sperm-associated protein subunit epsilon-like [Lingula anatina]